MTYEMYTTSSSDANSLEYDQLIIISSRDLCSNIKNGGGNGQGHGSCSGNSTQDIQCNLLQSLKALFSW